MKKVLMLAHVASMIDQFCMPNISLLKEMGCEVHVASNFEHGYTCTAEKIELLKKKLEADGIEWHQIDFARNPVKVGSLITAYGQLKKLFEKEQFAFAHSHGPVGGILCRMACGRFGVKAMHTAHGFHFYSGGPAVRWLIYYPVEKYFAKKTDILVTINREDYERADKKFKAKKTVYSPGIGVDLSRFAPVNEEKRYLIRKNNGIPDDKRWVLCVGELIPRKNQMPLIEAVCEMSDVFLTIAGTGPLADDMTALIADLKIGDRVKLLGFRDDISELVAACDCFAFPSFQEGLSVAVMEAMAAGCPIALSKIRGNVDLITEGEGGCFFEPNDTEGIRDAIMRVLNSDSEAMGRVNRDNIVRFGIDAVLPLYRQWYGELLE